MRHFFAPAASLSVTLMAMFGCGDPEATSVAVATAPVGGVAAMAVQIDDTEPADGRAATQQETASTTSKESSKTDVLEEAFKPPYRYRVDLFSTPRRALKAIQTNNDTGETVALRGFVNVDQPRVVLSVDGVIAPMAEGEEKYGIQVITIEPPKVVLQRGRERWTATLEN